MDYRILGKSGLNVSRFCLGTMTFGDQVNEIDAIAMVDYAIDNGVNFFDCADVYAGGQSEVILGKAVKSKRDKVVLTSKCAGKMSDDINDIGLSRGTIVRHVDASLKRLDTDYLDVLFLHFPDRKTDLETILFTMDMLIRSGKIRHYGISNFPAWMACSMVHKAREANAPAPVVTENPYNVLTRSLEDELLPFIQEYNIALMTHNPLAGGLLTGKHRGGKLATDSRFTRDAGYAKRYVTDANTLAMETVIEAAESDGVTPVQLAYQWLLSKEHVTSVICGISKMSQLEDNIKACCNTSVSKEALVRCDSVWDDLKGASWSYHY